jgi:hypothetical protein
MQVESSLSMLQRRRKDDPYKDFIPRMVFEASWGGRQAPTFTPKPDPGARAPPAKLSQMLNSKS